MLAIEDPGLTESDKVLSRFASAVAVVEGDVCFNEDSRYDSRMHRLDLIPLEFSFGELRKKVSFRIRWTILLEMF